MSASDETDKARAYRIGDAMDALWGWGSLPALGWRSVWHSPPGAIFGVWMDVVGDDDVVARLWGWDRDLSDQVPMDLVPLRQVGALVRAVDSVVADLTPAFRPTIQPLDPERSVQPIPASSPLSTARALAARRHGHVEPPLVHDGELRAMLARRWPGEAIVDVPGPDGEMCFRLRPYGSSQVLVGGKLDRGELGGGPLVGLQTFRVPGGHPGDRADERGAGRVIDDLDDWLRQTMPPAWVLERPVQQGYDYVRGGVS